MHETVLLLLAISTGVVSFLVALYIVNSLR